MSTGAQSGAGDGERLLAVFGRPLFAALDGDAPREAACALCLLADADESLSRPLATRLLDHLADADDRRPFLRTLATLAADHGDAVETALADAGATRRLRTAVEATEGWSFAQRADGGSVTEAVRQVVETDDTRDPGPGVAQRGGTDDGPAADPDRAAEREHRGDPAAVDRRDRLARAEQSRAFRAISLFGEFDDLTVVEPEQAVRYGSVLRTRATLDGEERGVALRLFDLPDEADARTEFAASVAESLARWDGVADHDGLVTVHDWGDHPRPWVATPYLDGSLADRGRPSAERALREIAHLAGALATCHRNGLVHGGIDPEAVVYPTSSLEGLPAPRLDNVGLMDAVRAHFEPSSYLDPRYAAPEYFSREYGSIDAATDVYALGTVCYRLLTGHPPFAGDYDEIRRGVLEERPPAPTEVNPRLPDAVDDVVAKATAKDKLTRYETAAAVRRDCWRLVQTLG
ncbi:serine/threonine protein kinase [Halomicroarcula sp. F13]|uniref:Serine/threonine protein kinase n=1 Tax=Haloarcula rubra TaxID=2487747 RepID=A0AAW4PQ87_9EURY|nr:serine/threonine protein kinase [Halomicroarcula rubra]MBX0322695.1 serine/threonine protein kinase [Halomicroarcula rubra]